MVLNMGNEKCKLGTGTGQAAATEKQSGTKGVGTLV
jgi:hypothetical protein